MFLKVLFVIFLIFLLIRLFARQIMVFLVKSLAKKMQRDMERQMMGGAGQQFQGFQQTRSQGDIQYRQTKKGKNNKSSFDDEGEYVDFEEI